MYGYRSAELMYALEDQINITAKDSALSEVWVIILKEYCA